MKVFNRSTALAVAVGLFFSASLHAQVVEHAKTCNGCTQRQIEALLPNCALGYRYVADFDADRLYLGCYQVEGTQPRMAPNGGPPRQRHYVYRQPPAHNQKTFEAYQNVYALNGHVMAQAARVSVNGDLRPVVSFGDDGYMNAYDMVNAIQNLDAVKNWMGTTTFTRSNTEGIPVVSPELSAALASLLNTTTKTWVLSFDGALNVTLAFHDGSQVTFHYDSNNGTWSSVPGSARDAHGNLVPDSFESIGGNGGLVYDFTSLHPDYDMTNFMRTIHDYNIPVTGDATEMVECVSTDTTVTCHYVIVPK